MMRTAGGLGSGRRRGIGTGLGTGVIGGAWAGRLVTGGKGLVGGGVWVEIGTTAGKRGPGVGEGVLAEEGILNTRGQGPGH